MEVSLLSIVCGGVKPLTRVYSKIDGGKKFHLIKTTKRSGKILSNIIHAWSQREYIRLLNLPERYLSCARRADIHFIHLSPEAETFLIAEHSQKAYLFEVTVL